MDWKTLSYLSTRKIKSLQNKKLKYFIQHKIPFSPYYNKLFNKNKINFSDIKTIEDLKKYLLQQRKTSFQLKKIKNISISY